MRHRCLGLLIVLLMPTLTFAQDDDDELPPGLLVTYSTKSHTVQRVDPDIAFAWDKAAPDERLAAGPFTAKWMGRILLRGEGKTRWHAFVQGKVEVRIDDKVVVRGETEKSTWVSGDEFDLGFGEKPFAVTFTRAQDAAQLKLFWSSSEFPLEPLPYHVLFHEPSAPEIALAARGRVLFETHRCANCHEEDETPTNLGVTNDERKRLSGRLDLPAPSLKHVGQGTNREWLVEKVMGVHLKREETAEEKPPHPSPFPAKPGRGDEGKMPHFGFTREEAEAVVAALIEQAKPVQLDAPSKLKEAERDKDLQAGQTLIRSVGCLACHTYDKFGEAAPFGGGSLSEIGQRRRADWLATWLVKPTQLNEHARMPVVSLSDKERAQIVLALLVPSPPSSGERVRVRGPNGGDGSDSQTKAKETPHPNPLPSKARGEGTGKEDPAQVARGWKLIESSRCAACHEFTQSHLQPALRPLLVRAEIDWTKSCLTAADKASSRPHVPDVDAKAIQAYVASWGGRVPTSLALKPPPSTIDRTTQGRRLLEQKNCLACHDRDESKGLSRLAASIAKADETLAGLHMTLIPPRLHAVGDRLHDMALAEAIQGGPKNPRLSWLRVRMPRYQHSPVEQAALMAHLVGHDRIPDNAPARREYPLAADKPDPQRLLAGRELLGGKGFSCVACHAVKDYTPKVTALGTRGSNLHLLGQRMRTDYYFRWTRAPLRIMPGVEMPNYQRPHEFILPGQLDQQLTAIWEALNDPNLTAPTNPAVVEQLLTVNTGERPGIVRDVFTVPGGKDGESVARAFAVGFDNGHSLLFDLDTASVRGWAFGDFARQRCEGKRWYWDLAGVPLATGFGSRPDVLLVHATTNEVIAPETGWSVSVSLLGYTGYQVSKDAPVGGFVGEPRSGLQWTYRLTFTKGDEKHDVDVGESLLKPTWPTPLAGVDGIQRSVNIALGQRPLRPWFRCVPPTQLHARAEWHVVPLIREQIDSEYVRPTDDPPPAGMPADARPFLLRDPGKGLPRGDYTFALKYRTTLQRVATAVVSPPANALVGKAEAITSVPGFRGVRLPLPRSIMPTAFTWDDERQLIFTSLKGHVYRAADSDGDGLADQLNTIEEGLAAPFGLLWWSPPKGSHVTRDDPDTRPFKIVGGGGGAQSGGRGVYIGPRPLPVPRLLVAHKPELLVLKQDTKKDSGNEVFRRDVLATGWGVTDDYHDWTCGIVQDSRGWLYIGLGSDYAFKNRPKEKSRWRGDILRIFLSGKIESMARGLRYPTGLALDDQDRLFVTDQQGVQNTFNELNLIQTGHRYGVPSRHEPEPDAPADPPAVQIPHPWTRSVNGVVFVPRRLGTPARPSDEANGTDRTNKSHVPHQSHPLASLGGHFLAAEYNNNSIIRLSVQDVDGVVQGAVYPFSRPTSAEAPLSATPNSGGKPVPQDSSSFIGPMCIGISPTGDIYVGGFQDGGWAGGLNMGDIVKLTPEGPLPNGLREIRATSRGFDLEFFHPVDAELARQSSQYKISGYTRVWKGDYATPDSGRHTGEVTDAKLDDAARTVSLTVKGLKPGHVYDVSVGEIGTAAQRNLWPAIGHYTLHRIPQ